MTECINAYFTPKETYSSEWYKSQEKRLTENINEMLKTFKNTFCVQPLIRITSPEEVEVTVFNRLTQEDFKNNEIEMYSEWNGVVEELN